MIKTVFKKQLSNCLKHANTAIVSIKPNVAYEILGRLKCCVIDFPGNKAHLSRLGKREIDAVISKSK